MRVGLPSPTIAPFETWAISYSTQTTPSALHGLMYTDRRSRGTRQWRPQMLASRTGLCVYLPAVVRIEWIGGSSVSYPQPSDRSRR